MKNQCINIHAESLDLTNKSDYVKVGKSPEQFFLTLACSSKERREKLPDEGLKWGSNKIGKLLYYIKYPLMTLY